MRKLVSVILDETGSMQSIKSDVIGGYNEFLGTMKQEDGEVLFSLLKFDSNHRTQVHSGIPVKEAPLLTNESYTPGASTPLLDATMQGIRDAEKHASDSDKVSIVIFTDGLENASRETKLEDLKSLIAEKEKAGWFFTFLGVGIDGFAQAAQMGIPGGATLNSTRTKGSAAFREAAHNVRYYSGGASAAEASYTDEQRKKTL